MAELFVTCPECGLREKLAHGHQEFDDPRGKCSHRLNPAKCPALRVPLIAARRMLDVMEWDAILASDEEIPTSPSFVEATIVPEMPEPIRPSASSGDVGLAETAATGAGHGGEPARALNGAE